MAAAGSKAHQRILNYIRRHRMQPHKKDQTVRKPQHYHHPQQPAFHRPHRNLGKAEKLEKRSKNVRERLGRLQGLEGGSEVHRRIVDYIKRRGFRVSASARDQFGIGKDQKSITYSAGRGSPEHELGHALMTPAGESLREHQQRLGKLTTKSRAMPEHEARAEEMAAFGMEPSIKRRAGVPPSRFAGAYEYHAQNKPDTYAAGKQRGKQALDAFEEGRRVVDVKGNVKVGTSVDAKINARALGKAEKPKVEFPQWLDRFPILHNDHVPDLETRAAVNEFQHKMPRHEAEASAHKQYVQDQLEDAAAHHLLGMKTSQGAGDMHAARKHGVMYGIVMKQLGHSALDAPPPAIANKAKQQSPSLYSFKPHKADAFALQDTEKSESDLKERFLILKKAAFAALMLLAK